MGQTLWAVLVLGLMGAPAEEAGQILAGSWWVNGNGTYGEMVLQLAAPGQVTGTIFGQPLTGTYDPATKRLTFKRQLNNQDTTGRQEFRGVLKRTQARPPRYALEGTFISLADEDWGKPGVKYPWTAEATRLPSFAEDFQALQGRWEPVSFTFSMKRERKLPDELHLNAPGTTVEVQGNQLLWDGKVIATFTHDLPSASLVKEIGFPDHRLLVLTLPSGKGFLCSYCLTEDGLRIAYPHTTACSRGSGQIISLKRPGK